MYSAIVFLPLLGFLIAGLGGRIIGPRPSELVTTGLLMLTAVLSWIAFFGAMGALNLWVAFRFATDTWVNFKLFGGIGLMLVFVIAQGAMLSKYLEEKS